MLKEQTADYLGVRGLADLNIVISENQDRVQISEHVKPISQSVA